MWLGPVSFGQGISDPGQTDNFARNEASLRLGPGDALVNLNWRHYEKFDSGYNLCRTVIDIPRLTAQRRAQLVRPCEAG